MNLDTLLHDALHQRAAQITTASDGWQDNGRRIQRSRRRRRGALAGTGALLAVAGVSLGLLTGAATPDNTDRQIVASGGPPSFVVDGVAVLAPPVKIGSVEYAGREHAVVAYLTDAPPGRQMDKTKFLWACTALADDDGHVTPDMPAAPCQGTNQPGETDFVLELLPLSQSGLPVPACRLGPMGNLDLILVSTRVTAATLKVSDGSTVPMMRVAGTETWPYLLYSGAVPAERFVGGHRLEASEGVLQDQPLGEAQTSGCPTNLSG